MGSPKNCWRSWQIVDICLENSYLEQSSVEVYKIPDILLYNPQKSLPFKNSLHERYSQLNKLEKEFAQELDKFSAKWCRNPSRSGYAIPLITRGDTQNFYPDFLVWYKNNIIAIDTSGEHLIKDKTDRKLLNILPSSNNSCRILVRFISKGKWNKEVEKIDDNGWTLWKRRINDGSLSVTNLENLPELIEQILETEN